MIPRLTLQANLLKPKKAKGCNNAFFFDSQKIKKPLIKKSSKKLIFEFFLKNKKDSNQSC
ncbi:hypothetical protein DLM78_13005 [Leptospira stimsonii]|uniref:Uncharacterized protein n=1 Tax=Leptospira stimsonii TaxID=2202203 RepID=A0A8B3CRT6_9LEPT|nr:hypothetical protein DLM78_13005 [Leptospira stimsonii]